MQWIEDIPSVGCELWDGSYNNVLWHLKFNRDDGSHYLPLLFYGRNGECIWMHRPEWDFRFTKHHCYVMRLFFYPNHEVKIVRVLYNSTTKKVYGES